MQQDLTDVYFKVYADKDSVNDDYYVDTLTGVLQSIPHWFFETECHPEDIKIPVIEPIKMTKEEFEALPEFQGY